MEILGLSVYYVVCVIISMKVFYNDDVNNRKYNRKEWDVGYSLFLSVVFGMVVAPGYILFQLHKKATKRWRSKNEL